MGSGLAKREPFSSDLPLCEKWVAPRSYGEHLKRFTQHQISISSKWLSSYILLSFYNPIFSQKWGLSHVKQDWLTSFLLITFCIISFTQLGRKAATMWTPLIFSSLLLQSVSCIEISNDLKIVFDQALNSVQVLQSKIKVKPTFPTEALPAIPCK